MAAGSGGAGAMPAGSQSVFVSDGTLCVVIAGTSTMTAELLQPTFVAEVVHVLRNAKVTHHIR